MISEELVESLRHILQLIPTKEQEKEIYESDKTHNEALFNYINQTTKTRDNFFIIKSNEGNLKNPMFISSETQVNLAYVTVTKKIFIKVQLLKRLI